MIIKPKNIILNNKEEKIELYNQNKEKVFEVFYEKAEEGKSFARKENGAWGWTNFPTPGKTNLFEKNEKIFSGKETGSLEKINSGKTSFNFFFFLVFALAFSLFLSIASFLVLNKMEVE